MSNAFSGQCISISTAWIPQISPTFTFACIKKFMTCFFNCLLQVMNYSISDPAAEKDKMHKAYMLLALRCNGNYFSLIITVFRWKIHFWRIMRLGFECNVTKPIVLEYGCQSFFTDAEGDDLFISIHIKESVSRSIHGYYYQLSLRF